MSQKVASEYKAYMLLELTVDKLKGTGVYVIESMISEQALIIIPLTRFGDYHTAPSKQGQW